MRVRERKSEKEKIKYMKFNMQKTYVRIDGWRGYEKPIYSVAGANDTGSWSDSPCRTEVATKELAQVRKILRKNKIPHRHVVCESSNVFCAHRYIVVPPECFMEAKILVRSLLAETETSLLYEA